MKRAIIIGAGPGGLTTAIALRRAGIEAHVFERAVRPRAAGSGLTLWPNAFKALETIGAAAPVRAVCRPLSGIAMYSWRGDVLSETSGHALEHLAGGTGAALLRAELVQVLLSNVEHVTWNARCVGVCQDGPRVTALLSDGREVTADLLVAADGLRSVIGQQILGPPPLRFAGYTVWRGTAGRELDDGLGVTMLGRGAQFGFFPMRGGRTYWFAALNAPGAGYWNGAPQRPLLIERFSDWCGPVRALIEATDPAAIVATDIYEREALRSWGHGRVVVLGDAAHPSTPNLGQGACQAIEDAVVLGRCVAADDALPTALGTYQARRRRRANAMTSQARLMARVGRWRGRIPCRIRDALIKATPRVLGRRNLQWMFDFQP